MQFSRIMHLWLLLTFSFVAHGARLGSEPQCSKFHYEEQLLEKMIRMEIKVEDIEKRIMETNQRVLDVLENLQAEKNDMKKENRELQRQYSKEMEERMTEIVNLKETLLTKTIAFKAGGPADKNLETGQTIIFKETKIDIGGAYDNITGIFTVPFSGTYLFTIHLCIRNGISMFYGIMVDDSIQTSGRFYDSDAWSCYTADAIVVLQGGERVYAKCLTGVGSSDALYEHSTSTYNYWSTFSGLLVHR